jgi:hypothetical protein
MDGDGCGKEKGIEDDSGQVHQEGRLGAMSAGDPGSSGGASRPQRRMASESRRYVTVVLEHYLWLPGTPRAASRGDRRCARELFQSGVPVDVVVSALTLGVARRTFRCGDPLPQVRALAYFLPVIQEFHALDPGPVYIRHLAQKLRPLAAVKARAHSPPP